MILKEEPHVEPGEKVPFSFRILEEKLPKGYRPPTIGEYDGSKDPEDHLRKFRNAALLHQYSDAVKCRVFLNTLSGSAQKWFNGLPHGSITFFQNFKTVFLRHFASSKKYQKTYHCLFALKQGSAEPLRSYIKRFNQVAQDVPSATSEILMSAFSHGFAEGEFFRDLIPDPVKNFDSVLERATSYINVEEAQAARRKADRTLAAANKSERRAPQQPAQPLPRAREIRPLFQPGQEIRLAPRVATVHAPRPGPWKSRYCTYHRSRTHDTNHCFQFARDSRRAAELGLPPPELAPQVLKMMEEQCAVAGSGGRSHPDPAGSNGQQPGRVREPGEAQDAENRNNAAVREIGMIFGGPTDRDSGRARKSHVYHLEVYTVGCSQEQAAGPVISFGP
ncbi:uncharacterized protein LOC122013758 [Zingiber officinale]|uniref:uncharacterized protein LOC122013758 n=1 Tax=Zingiber officinale TaxID=94328 RepID=UPI001C4C704F|nr:uncharacterized protein LOC122013758 [Zingiber officinale]